MSPYYPNLYKKKKHVHKFLYVTFNAADPKQKLHFCRCGFRKTKKKVTKQKPQDIGKGSFIFWR